MSNQHIQKQIDLLENADIWKEVEDDFSIGDGGSHSEINLDKVIAFLKTSLENAWKDAERETAEYICVIIDEIEALSETNTLEEWKQYKHIRNAIREKYIFKQTT